MSHKTLINGTAYNVIGGTTLVNGTSYSISKGNTLIGGTGYNINFGGGSDISSGFTLYSSWSDTNYSLGEFYMQPLPDGNIIARKADTSQWDILQVGMDGFTVLSTLNPDSRINDTSCGISGDYFCITKSGSTTNVYFYKYNYDGTATLLDTKTFSQSYALVSGRLQGTGEFVLFYPYTSSRTYYTVASISNDTVTYGTYNSLTTDAAPTNGLVHKPSGSLYYTRLYSSSQNRYYMSYTSISGTSLSTIQNVMTTSGSDDYYLRAIPNNLFINNIICAGRTTNSTTVPFQIWKDRTAIYTQAQNGTSTAYGSDIQYQCYRAGTDLNFLVVQDYSDHNTIGVYADDGTLIDSIVATNSQFVPAQNQCFTKIADYTYFQNVGSNNYIFTYK